MIERHRFCELRNGAAAAGITNLDGCENKALEMFAFLMFLCVDGEAEIEINLTRKSIHPRELIIIPEKVNVVLISKTDNFSLMYTALSDELSNDIYYNFLHMDFWRYIHHNYVFAYHKDFSMPLNLLFKHNIWIVENITSDNKVIKNCVYNLMAVLYYGLVKSGALKEYGNYDESRKKDEMIYKFWMLARQHSTTNREVAFYANELSVSPTYLYMLIKENCGTTPKKIIEEELLIHIKLHLLYSKDSIRTIAAKTGFGDTAYLCNFFQRKTNMTPMEYRKKG